MTDCTVDPVLHLDCSPTPLIQVPWPEPPVVTLNISIGLPCGVHTEIREFDPPNWKVVRTSAGRCDSIWCMLNSGEWKESPKFRWIVERMMTLGWAGIGKGEPCATYYEKALLEWNEQSGCSEVSPPDPCGPGAATIPQPAPTCLSPESVGDPDLPCHNQTV